MDRFFSGVRAPLVGNQCFKLSTNTNTLFQKPLRSPVCIISQPLDGEQNAAARLAEKNPVWCIFFYQRGEYTQLIWSGSTKPRCALRTGQRSASLSPPLIFSLPAWRQNLIQPCCLVGFGSRYNAITHAKCQQLLACGKRFVLAASFHNNSSVKNSTSSRLRRGLCRTSFKFRCVTLMPLM